MYVKIYRSNVTSLDVRTCKLYILSLILYQGSCICILLQNTSEDMKGFYRDTSLINTHRSFPRLINNALYLYLYIPV